MEWTGSYRLDSEPGNGAMGVVIRSIDNAIGRAVAIKINQLNQFAAAKEKGFRLCVCRCELAPHQTPSG